MNLYADLVFKNGQVITVNPKDCILRRPVAAGAVASGH